MSDYPERATVTFENWRNPNHGAAYKNGAGKTEYVRGDLYTVLAAERDALKARVDAAETDLELEGEWAVIQPNADPMQDPRVKALVEAAQSAHDMLAGCLFANMRVKGQYLIRRDVVSELHAALRDMEQGNK